MMTVCLRYARHRAEAEDLLQDSFIKIFDNMKTLLLLTDSTNIENEGFALPEIRLSLQS